MSGASLRCQWPFASRPSQDESAAFLETGAAVADRFRPAIFRQLRFRKPLGGGPAHRAQHCVRLGEICSILAVDHPPILVDRLFLRLIAAHLHDAT